MHVNVTCANYFDTVAHSRKNTHEYYSYINKARDLFNFEVNMNTKQVMSALMLIFSANVAVASGGSPAVSPAPAPIDSNTVTKSYSGLEWQRHALDIELSLIHI